MAMLFRSTIHLSLSLSLSQAHPPPSLSLSLPGVRVATLSLSLPPEPHPRNSRNGLTCLHPSSGRGRRDSRSAHIHKASRVRAGSAHTRLHLDRLARSLLPEGCWGDVSDLLGVLIARTGTGSRRGATRTWLGEPAGEAQKREAQDKSSLNLLERRWGCGLGRIQPAVQDFLDRQRFLFTIRHSKYPNRKTPTTKDDSGDAEGLEMCFDCPARGA